MPESPNSPEASRSLRLMEFALRPGFLEGLSQSEAGQQLPVSTVLAKSIHPGFDLDIGDPHLASLTALAQISECRVSILSGGRHAQARSETSANWDSCLFHADRAATHGPVWRRPPGAQVRGKVSHQNRRSAGKDGERPPVFQSWPLCIVSVVPARAPASNGRSQKSGSMPAHHDTVRWPASVFTFHAPQYSMVATLVLIIRDSGSIRCALRMTSSASAIRPMAAR